ncbi:MAG: regulatory protein RecX [Corynebacterium sp.]|nr:regulatory protein RecX [Corynebacterium sp.]
MSDRSVPDRIAELSAAIADLEAGRSGRGGFADQLRWEELKLPVRNRALTLLEQRPRSTAELTQRLLAAEYPRALVEEVIGDLTRVGMLDDERFAREWVRQRAVARKKSARALDAELRDKGIAEDLRRRALEQLTAADAAVTVRQLCAKKARQLRTIPTTWQEKQKALAKIAGMPARRGFPPDLCMNLAREALAARVAELGPEEH